MKEQPKTPFESLKKAALSVKLTPNKYNRKPKHKGRLTKWDSLQREAMSTEFTGNNRNISKTARVLGLSRNAVLRKLKRYGLRVQEKQP